MQYLADKNEYNQFSKKTSQVLYAQIQYLGNLYKKIRISFKINMSYNMDIQNYYYSVGGINMSDKKLVMKLFKEKFGVCRLEIEALIPEWAQAGQFYSITKTSDELSVVCCQDNIPDGIKCEKDWRILKIEGILDFSLIGILASISVILATNNISIFAISTYNTDYILVKEKDINNAVKVLSCEQYEIIKEI